MAYDCHVKQYRYLFWGLIMRSCRTRFGGWNLAGIYHPRLAKMLLGERI